MDAARPTRAPTDGAVLYVTFDGVLQPIGYSQVVRLVTALALRGVPYRVLSCERAEDLRDAARVAAVRARLADAGVAWDVLPYDTAGSGRAAARNIGRLTAAVTRLAASRRVRLVHARSYHAALAALAARQAAGVPYLFDARSYWIDERIVDGRWFTRPTVRRAAKALERQLYRRAAAVVTLTALQGEDLRGGLFGPWTGAPLVAIPTCADYEEFRLRDTARAASLPADARARLEGRRVIALIGSINSSYYPTESAALIRAVLAREPRAHALALSAQTQEYAELFARAGIAPERYTIARAAHEQMPAWLASIEWGVQLLRENFAKRASVPTKLAEFFAAGVRPVHYGCNPEVTEWVRRAGSGVVLGSLDDAEIERAARAIAETSATDPAALARARAATYDHFSLASGLDRYERLLRALLDDRRAST